MADAPPSALLGTDEGLTKDPRPVEDFSKEAEAAMQEAKRLAAMGLMPEALAAIQAVEKRARQASDGLSVSKLLVCAVTLYKEKGMWTEVADVAATFAKKRGQLKRAIVDTVQLCMGWLDTDMPNHETKVALLLALLELTDGKIFVEVQRARLTKIHAKIKEDEGNVEEAAEMLQEVQVETFGGMDKLEKAQYICEQMRLVVAREDFIRCQIISKKINPKLIEAEDFKEIKLTYYKLMVQYHLHERAYLDVANDYYRIFDTSTVQEDSALWTDVLQHYVLYVLLASCDKKQTELLEKLQTEQKKKLAEIPIFGRLVDKFLEGELVDWPLKDAEELRTTAVFCDAGGEERWTTFRVRVVQHNLLTLGKYFTRISLARAAELLGVTTDEVEEQLAELVNSKFIVAKMDRLDGVIRFGENKNAAAILNDWATNIDKILSLVDVTCHSINKERMVQDARSKIVGKRVEN